MEASGTFNLDAATGLFAAGLIEAHAFPRLTTRLAGLPMPQTWQPGEKLRILLVGYSGARNTGADARVAAIVDQIYGIFGADTVHVGVLSLDRAQTEAYFDAPTEVLDLDAIFFRDIARTCASYHLAILCEGSCFKSKFTNVLTLLFVTAAGLMRKLGKPCIAYGSEAGDMDPYVRKLVQRYCSDVYVISRTEPSMRVVSELGLRGELGTDTAWSFTPSSPERGEELLSQAGWDGKKPVVGAAVINPFCWPVKPSLSKLCRMTVSGVPRHDHHMKWYFFASSEARTQAFERYVGAIAGSLDAFVEAHDAFPVLIGMESLDHKACNAVRARMRNPAPVFESRELDAYDLVAVLRKLSLLVTSRYHARVLSMEGGVPSCAISMDERLENLLRETGHLEDYYLTVDDPRLAERLPEMMERLWSERSEVGRSLAAAVPGYVARMEAMGATLKSFALQHFPGLAQ